MDRAIAKQILAGVVTSFVTAAALALAGVVSRQPSEKVEREQLQRDIQRIDARCERIENLLLERK